MVCLRLRADIYVFEIKSYRTGRRKSGRIRTTRWNCAQWSVPLAQDWHRMHYRTAPVFSQCMGSFNNPALRQGQNPFVDFCSRPGLLRGVVQGVRCAVTRIPYDFNTDIAPLLNVASTRSAIPTIGVELLQVGCFGARLYDNRGGCISIVHAGGSPYRGYDQAHRIDPEVTLSPLELLACIKTTFATLRRAAIGLGIDDRCSWRTLASMRERHCSRRRSCIYSNTLRRPSA